VIGATGFIGNALSECLTRNGVDVVATGRGVENTSSIQYTWITLDLPNPPPQSAFENVDVVFHLAAKAHSVSEARQDPALYDAVNHQGARVVAEAASRAGVRRLVLMSSVKAIKPPALGPVAEDALGWPTDPYGRSKRQAEEAVLHIAQSGGCEAVVLRPALVYGPGVRGNLASVMTALERGRKPPLPHVQNRRSMVGLEDLVTATLLSARHPAAAGQRYVVTDGEVYSTDRIIDALAAAVGHVEEPRFRIPLSALRVGALAGDAYAKIAHRRLPIDTAALDRLAGDSEYVSEKIHKQLSFVPTMTLERAAAEMVTYRS